MDTAAQKMYARIPELHDSYIYLDMAMASEGSEELTASMELLQNPVSLNPDPATLKTLLTRYSEILFDGFGENIAGDDTLSVEGVGEACRSGSSRGHKCFDNILREGIRKRRRA